MIKEKIYYEPQDGWGPKEYYYLHRFLHRRFFYYEKYHDEIARMDTSRMSDETKVLIYCIIHYYHNDFLFSDYPNLSSLADIKPLSHELLLDVSPLPEKSIYKEMNVAY